MKKNYLWIAAAAAMFAACSQNDVINEIVDEDVAIGFNYNGTEKNTRAEIDIDWFKVLNTNKFGVYGFKSDAPIFTDEEVYCSTTNASLANCEWSHPTKRFWDKGAADAYDFYAYAPYAAPTGTEPSLVYNPAFDKANEKFTFSGLSLITDIESDGADKVVAKAVRDIDYDDVKNHLHNSKPTVQFDFHHILSKLSFKVYTDIVKANAQNGVATFYLKSISIDFPSSNTVTDQVTFYAKDYSDATLQNKPLGAITYGSYTNMAGNGTYSETVYNKVEADVQNGPVGYEVPNSATKPTLPATPDNSDVACKTYIVTPVAAATYTSHQFGIKVVYNTLYADGTLEQNCQATATLTYAPTQNSHHVVTIKIDPAQIDFCVESVAGWDNETTQAVTVN